MTEVQLECLRQDFVTGWTWATLQDGPPLIVNTHWEDEAGVVWTVIASNTSEVLLRPSSDGHLPKGRRLQKYARR